MFYSAFLLAFLVIATALFKSADGFISSRSFNSRSRLLTVSAEDNLFALEIKEFKQGLSDLQKNVFFYGRPWGKYSTRRKDAEVELHERQSASATSALAASHTVDDDVAAQLKSAELRSEPIEDEISTADSKFVAADGMPDEGGTAASQSDSHPLEPAASGNAAAAEETRNERRGVDVVAATPPAADPEAAEDAGAPAAAAATAVAAASEKSVRKAAGPNVGKPALIVRFVRALLWPFRAAFAIVFNARTLKIVSALFLMLTVASVSLLKSSATL